MRHIEDLTEHDMVAVYLKAEIRSERYAEDILGVCAAGKFISMDM